MIQHTTHLDKPDGATYGPSLRAFGVNLLVRDVLTSVQFHCEVLGVEQVYSNPDFAIMRHAGAEWMLHADHTYHSNPFKDGLDAVPARGAGCELRLYGIDPDAAAERAAALGCPILAAPADKPHGLRECYLVDPDGYVWVPGIASGAKRASKAG